MKKLLLLLPLTFLPLPVSAITWEQFWSPFTYDGPRYHVLMCDKKVYHEEYIPGNYRRRGYVRYWTEVRRVPCYDYDNY